MPTITSPDGTPIAYQRSGAGPPLVLIHGTGSAAARWAPLVPRLAQRFTVLAVDRRGRGASGDAPAYALAREFEDIAAVVDSLGAPANLLGHSFGALCALEAALLTPNVRRLILYEPALPLPGAPIYPPGILARMQALFDNGDREGLLALLYQDVAGISPAEMEQLRASPAWPARVAAAHTVLRESLAEDEYRFDPRRLQGLRVPTLLLAGADSPPFLRAATDAVAAALPNARLAVLPGQKHIAMDTAPDLFLQEVLAFLD